LIPDCARAVLYNALQMPTIGDLIASWEGHAVIARFDAATGAWIFICLHDNTLGASTGGSRMALYPTPADGLLDAMRLSEGMTSKWAAANLPFGGGKAVIALQRKLQTEERTALLQRYGQLIESLCGAFRTGEDLGTSSEDMLLVSQYTRYVHGFDAQGQKRDPSPFTAHGVAAGMRAALTVAFGNSSFESRTVLIEGVGNVGSRLAEQLTAEGADLILADLDEGRAQEVAEHLGASTVSLVDVTATPCDVYSPCAIGATLNEETIPQLACRIVAGSANNQLRDAADAERLRQRDILYVPDFIINAGGAMAFAEIDQGLSDEEEILSRVAQIGTTSQEVLVEAAERGETTLAAARRRVEATLARAQDSRHDKVPSTS
jgi:leucine dehydrogenase